MTDFLQKGLVRKILNLPYWTEGQNEIITYKTVPGKKLHTVTTTSTFHDKHCFTICPLDDFTMQQFVGSSECYKLSTHADVTTRKVIKAKKSMKILETFSLEAVFVLTFLKFSLDKSGKQYHWIFQSRRQFIQHVQFKEDSLINSGFWLSWSEKLQSFCKK